jgi:hypothetical protein
MNKYQLVLNASQWLRFFSLKLQFSEISEFPEIEVQSPNQIVDGYVECLTARCQINQYMGVYCNSKIQKYGLCGKLNFFFNFEFYYS